MTTATIEALQSTGVIGVLLLLGAVAAWWGERHIEKGANDER